MYPGVLVIIVLVVLTGLSNVCGFPGGVAENVVAAVSARRRSERDRERLHEERIRRIVTLQNELRASIIGGVSDAILPLVRRNNDADNNRSGFVASAAGTRPSIKLSIVAARDACVREQRRQRQRVVHQISVVCFVLLRRSP